VATVSEPAAAFEGHPFIVEAGVSLGGQALRDGINVYRFANRIPLLFEAGNDVVTQVRGAARTGMRRATRRTAHGTWRVCYRSSNQSSCTSIHPSIYLSTY